MYFILGQEASDPSWITQGMLAFYDALVCLIVEVISPPVMAIADNFPEQAKTAITGVSEFMSYLIIFNQYIPLDTVAICFGLFLLFTGVVMLVRWVISLIPGM